MSSQSFGAVKPYTLRAEYCTTQAANGKIGVLFVCLGNICRSPTAEAVFKDVVKRASVAEQFDIDSCGTGGGSDDWYLPGGFSYHEGAHATYTNQHSNLSGSDSSQVWTCTNLVRTSVRFAKCGES